MSSHGLWVERYRPSTLDTYVGNETLKTKVERFIEEQNVPHLLLYGRAGGGKTTLAKIIVNAIECDYLYINASDERNIDLVRDKLKNFASSVGFKSNKIVKWGGNDTTIIPKMVDDIKGQNSALSEQEKIQTLIELKLELLAVQGAGGL